MRLVSFRLGEARGAVDALAVREISRMVLVTSLPGAPPVVEGVVAVRGDAVPVVDVRRRLGLPARAAADTDWLLVVSGAGRTVALRVDDVEDVIEVPDGAVRAAVGMAGAAPTVAGLARLDDGLLVVHDAGAFLTEAEAVAVAAARRSATPAPGPDAGG